MRSLGILVLASCGRLGFDESELLPPDPDPAPGMPNLCNPRPIGNVAFPAGQSAVKLRATALSNGHAIAIQTDANDIYMVRLDAAGDVVSTHLPFAPGYELHGISQVEDRPFVYLFTSGAGYIKLLLPDWDSYDTGPSGEERPMDPQQAPLPSGSAAIFGVMPAGTLEISTIDADNMTAGSADYAPPATFASFGATPSGARVVVANAGMCETFTIASNGITGPRHLFSPCFEPRLATLGNEGAVLYLTTPTGPLARHQIPADANEVGMTTMLEIATNPRIATIDDAIWVAYLRGTGDARLIRFAGEAVTMREYPSITDSFDLLPSGAFWVSPTGVLNTGSPCL